MKKEKKAKEIYEPKKGLTGQGDDYHIYTMNMKIRNILYRRNFYRWGIACMYMI